MRQMAQLLKPGMSAKALALCVLSGVRMQFLVLRDFSATLEFFNLCVQEDQLPLPPSFAL